MFSFRCTVPALFLPAMFKKDDGWRPARIATASFSRLVVSPVSSRANERGFLAATAVRLFQAFLWHDLIGGTRCGPGWGEDRQKEATVQSCQQDGRMRETRAVWWREPGGEGGRTSRWTTFTHDITPVTQLPSHAHFFFVFGACNEQLDRPTSTAKTGVTVQLSCYKKCLI